MAEIIVDTSELTRERAIEEYMRLFKISHREAAFYISIVRGEIEGDMVLVNSEDTEDSAYSYLD